MWGCPQRLGSACLLPSHCVLRAPMRCQLSLSASGLTTSARCVLWSGTLPPVHLMESSHHPPTSTSALLDGPAPQPSPGGSYSSSPSSQNPRRGTQDRVAYISLSVPLPPWRELLESRDLALLTGGSPLADRTWHTAGWVGTVHRCGERVAGLMVSGHRGRSARRRASPGARPPGSDRASAHLEVSE